MDSRNLGVVGLALVLLGATQTGSGQSPGREDVLSALLAEVRGLRAVMEHMASAGPRIQLALGRLQIQEQRVNTMIRRQDEIAGRIPSEEEQVERLKQTLADHQEELNRDVPPEVRRSLERESVRLKSAIERLTAALGQLRTEEAQLVASIAAEQGRWFEINAQIEELERTLRDAGRRR